MLSADLAYPSHHVPGCRLDSSIHRHLLASSFFCCLLDLIQVHWAAHSSNRTLYRRRRILPLLFDALVLLGMRIWDPSNLLFQFLVSSSDRALILSLRRQILLAPKKPDHSGFQYQQGSARQLHRLRLRRPLLHLRLHLLPQTLLVPEARPRDLVLLARLAECFCCCCKTPKMSPP